MAERLRELADEVREVDHDADSRITALNECLVRVEERLEALEEASSRVI